jgi:NADH-quinone oxidoreductase subunit H
VGLDGGAAKEVQQEMALPQTILTFLELIIFPGFIFIILLALIYEWLDRKFYAKLQNRYGPLHTGPKGFYQPFADFIKLLAKEDIVPGAADRPLFVIAPILLLVLPLTAIFCIPIIGPNAYSSFQGDLIFVIFALTMIAIVKFLGAWGSTNRFSTVGGVRLALQLFGYEIPLALVLIAPVIAAREAGALSISQTSMWIAAHPWVPFALIPGIAIALICFLAEIEKIPFDIPEAEQEIVAGWLTEYSGKKLGLIRLATDVELVLAGALISALFLGGPNGPVPNIIGVDQALHTIYFLIKTTVVVLILSNLRTLFARLRIDQMVRIAWKYLVPIAILQLLLVYALIVWGLI